MIIKHWNKLLNTDCTVIQLDKTFVFPIYKNGSTSLHQYAKENNCKIYRDEELKNLNCIPKEVPCYIFSPMFYITDLKSYGNISNFGI